MESTTELESLRARALSGDSQAQYEFGKLLRERTSDDARDDQAQGEGWLRRASENGHVLASYELACILAALRDDFINAIPLWRVAAMQDHALSAYNLGVSLLQPDRSPKELAVAIEWIDRAESLGLLGIAADLRGLCHYFGIGCKKDVHAALASFKTAAGAGSPSGHFNAAIVLESIGHRFGERGSAVSHYRLAAELSCDNPDLQARASVALARVKTCTDPEQKGPDGSAFDLPDRFSWFSSYAASAALPGTNVLRFPTGRAPLSSPL